MNVTHRLIATHDVIACTPICTPLSVRNGPSTTTTQISFDPLPMYDCAVFVILFGFDAHNLS